MVLVLSFLFLLPIGTEELTYLREALRAINLDEEDLKYEKKWTERDPFRLSIVDTFLDNPLSMPNRVYSICDTAFHLRKNLPELLHFLSRKLDIEFGGEPIKTSFKLPNAPSFIRKNLENLVGSLIYANEFLRKAVEGMTKEELDTLIYNSVSLWADEDDTTDDTLRGVLSREFNLPSYEGMELEASEILRIAKKFNQKYLHLSAYITLKAIQDFVQDLDKIPHEKGILFETETPIGKVIVGGVGENRYEENYAILIDISGDDRYLGRCGASLGGIEGSPPISSLLDLCGNDTYLSSKCLSFGAGILGIGVLFDENGNDLYRASHISLGAGLFGVGIFCDEEGADIYETGFFSLGAGNFGIGIFDDEEGNDSYRAVDFAEGFGSVKGAGILLEGGGNDLYYAGGRYIHHPLLPRQYRSFAQGFAIGWRKDASGGIGILFDFDGNDLYYSEVYGQGASYWYSLGALIDRKGNDTYVSAEYAQGAGIHLSIGYLYDLEGDDHYYSRHGPSQGEGHDLSIGVLIDEEGDDTYEVSGGQGIGLTNSVGIFIDKDGNDTYMSYEKIGQGSANWARGFGGVGIFLDLSGEDTYGKKSRGKNNSFWTQGTYGVGIDKEK